MRALVLVVPLGILARDFVGDIACDISAGVRREFADVAVAFAPSLVEKRRGVQGHFGFGRVFLEYSVIAEIMTEESDMIMRPTVLVAIFAAVVEAEFSDLAAKSLSELLPMVKYETAIGWKVFGIVGQGEK